MGEIIETGKLFNLQEELLNYRVHNTQVSKKRELQQIQSALESRLKLLKYLNYTFNDNEYNLLKKIIQRNVVTTFDEIKDYFILKQKMILANSNNFFDSNGFQKYLSELQNQNFQKYFVNREKYYPIICFQYFYIKKKYGFRLKTKEELKMVVKCLVFFKENK